MTEFFTPEPLLWQQGIVWYEPFSGVHLGMLLACSALVILLVHTYQMLDEIPRDRLLRVLSCLPAAFVLARDAQSLVLGLLSPAFWPLHICNLCEFAALAWALVSRRYARTRSLLFNLVYFWGLLGGLGALLLPGWRYCPLWSFASLSGYVEHAILMAIALCPLSTDELHLTKHDLAAPVIVLALGMLVFRVVNPLLDTNFFFVTNPQAVGGPFTLLYTMLGDPFWLVGYLACATLCWLVLLAVSYRRRL